MNKTFTCYFSCDNGNAHVVNNGQTVKINNNIVQCWYFESDDNWASGVKPKLIAKTSKFSYSFIVTAALPVFVNYDHITKELLKTIGKDTPVEIILSGIVKLYSVYETPEEK